MNENKIINMSKKTYITVVIMLAVLLLGSILLTYLVPSGHFESSVGANGEIIYNYDKYIQDSDSSGINIFKGIFAPILVLTSGDGLTLIMLSIFLLIVTGTFQVMSDANGMKVLVQSLIKRFSSNKKVLIAVITLVFMMFGSFFGLFEETLALYPLIIIVTVGLGYDSFTGFLICIVASAFGFASALTNPFTVITASEILGINPMTHIFYRVIIFLVMYGLLLGFVFLHIRKITKTPEASPTYENDINKKEQYAKHEEIENSSLIGKTYLIFLICALLVVITVTSIESLRSYIVVFLMGFFLIGGPIAGYICMKDFKKVMKSFLDGVISAAPTILLILMAASVKFILEESSVLPTIANTISHIVDGKNTFLLAVLIYLIILVLEFFISSSTAKAIFVMGILSCVSIELSKEMIVLVYLFGDGFTNVLYPTSPVLLIALSMIGMNYLSWVKHSKWLFLFNFLLVLLFIFIGIQIGY